MKNQPTDLELFQAQRIEALEKEIIRLNIIMENGKTAIKRAEHNMRVTDPVFLSPIIEKDYSVEGFEILMVK